MPRISEEERSRRRNMMQSVLGTHEMEGMFADKATVAIMDSYVSGEFDMDEFSSAMENHARSLVHAASTLVAVA